MKVTNNQVIGTKDLRNKIVLQDSYDVDMCYVEISNNELSYGLIGLVNIAATQLKSDVLNKNKFNNYSFFVEASYDYAAGKENFAVYKGDKSADGKWVIHDDASIKETSFYGLIEKAVEEANKKGADQLQITGLNGYEEVMYTFTWYKDAIYWEQNTETPTPTPGHHYHTTPTPTPEVIIPEKLPKSGDKPLWEIILDFFRR